MAIRPEKGEAVFILQETEVPGPPKRQPLFQVKPPIKIRGECMTEWRVAKTEPAVLWVVGAVAMLLSAQTLVPHGLGSHPSSETYCLHDFGKV